VQGLWYSGRRRHLAGQGGGTKEGIPLFNSVAEAVRKTGANATMVFVRPPAAATPSWKRPTPASPSSSPSPRAFRPRYGRAMRFLKQQPDASWSELSGPHHPWRVQNRHHAGVHPLAGRVGVVSRSGTLTYEAVWQLSKLKLGQSTCVGLGGDPIVGTSFIDTLKLSRTTKNGSDF